MKRKSQKNQIHICRAQKKHKSQGFGSKSIKELPCFKESQKVSKGVMEEILANLEQKLLESSEKEALHQLTQSCLTLFQSVYTLASPENHEDQVISVKQDKQPSRVNFETICGFDKLKTYKRQLKTTNSAYHISNFDKRNSKLNAFGVFRNVKRQYSKVQCLVPLDLSKQNEFGPEEAQQALYRERLDALYNIDCEYKNNHTQKNKISQTLNSLQEDCQYDYNGQIISLGMPKALCNSKNVRSDVLKTTYRIVEQSERGDRKKIKGGLRRIPALERRFLSKEVITNKNSRVETARENFNVFNNKASYQVGHDINMKNTLEAKLKECKLNFKPVERPEMYRQRISRVL